LWLHLVRDLCESDLSMIKVLQNWEEVNQITHALKSQGLPTHLTIQKNWDQFLLQQILVNQDRQSWMLDLGCGDCCTLDFLAALGFTNLHGIDLEIKPELKQQSSQLPYRLYEGNMTKTSLPAQFYDVAVSISVIEHGVDLEAFFQESSRLLKPGGLLFVTTDYWAEKLPIDSSIQPFGLTWQIFSQAEMEAAIALANQHSFALEQSGSIPACADSPVSWYDKHYTFIALLFKKVAP
jgi:SAM-dependent methyltransferase